MADKEYKSFDSRDVYNHKGFRLTADAEVRDGKHGKMVRIQSVSTSALANDRDDIEEMWIEANVNDYQADKAAFLKKGDVLHDVYGKPYFRRWGDAGDKVTMCIQRAQLDIPLELEKKLKERGFTPGEKKTGGKATTKTKRREVQELPED